MIGQSVGVAHPNGHIRVLQERCALGVRSVPVVAVRAVVVVVDHEAAERVVVLRPGACVSRGGMVGWWDGGMWDGGMWDVGWWDGGMWDVGTMAR